MLTARFADATLGKIAEHNVLGEGEASADRLLSTSKVAEVMSHGDIDKAFDPIRTERLVLRQAGAGDAGAMQSYRSLPEVARFQSWTSFDNIDAQRLVEEQSGLAPNTPGTWFQLVILDRASSSLMGDLALRFREDDQRQVEIGINLAPAHQGRGYAAEAVQSVLGYLFIDLDKHRVSAITDAANEAAARVFRRVGFRQEGHFLEHVWYKGGYGSEYLFAILASEWRSSSA